MSTRFGSSVVVVAANLAAVAVITAVLFPLGAINHTVPALLFLVPIVAASVMAGWRASVLVAVGAALAYALAFLPPVGAVRIGLTEDVLAFVTFLLVSVAVAALKGPAAAGRRDRLLDDQSAALLRGVSHDLRNPLNTIHLVSSDLLAGGVHDDRTRDRMLGLVVEESRRLDRMVGNLLSLSRVQAGTFVPRRGATDVAELVDEVAARLSRVHGRRVAVERADRVPPGHADPVQVDQLLTNLVENALVHTTADVAVVVTADRDDVVVTVRDDGPGLPAHVIKAQFSEPVPSSSSTGIGLTICKAIVDAHGGRLWACPHQPTGTLVSFSLPVAR